MLPALAKPSSEIHQQEKSKTIKGHNWTRHYCWQGSGHGRALLLAQKTVPCSLISKGEEHQKQRHDYPPHPVTATNALLDLSVPRVWDKTEQDQHARALHKRCWEQGTSANEEPPQQGQGPHRPGSLDQVPGYETCTFPVTHCCSLPQGAIPRDSSNIKPSYFRNTLLKAPDKVAHRYWRPRAPLCAAVPTSPVGVTEA